MARFDYLIDKIRTAEMQAEPFDHLYIEDFFSPEDFAAIIADPQIQIPPAADDEALFEHLGEAGYKVIDFPGCIVDRQAYLDWHRDKGGAPVRNHNTCEGFGMTLRLMDPKPGVLQELNAFLAGAAFNGAIASRYGIDLADCTIDGGIQKYLDGYEISPHPDIRRKAATFMVNINPHAASEQADHHTHYLRMKPDYAYVPQFWEQRQDCDRCWVPWDWCDTLMTQPRNNSIVVFSPANDTVHAVKANYDHLAGQRTQLYGNLWYKRTPALHKVEWEQLAGGSLDAIRVAPRRMSTRQLVKAVLPMGVRKALAPAYASLVGRRQGKDGSYHRRQY